MAQLFVGLFCLFACPELMQYDTIGRVVAKTKRITRDPPKPRLWWQLKDSALSQLLSRK